MLPNDMWLEVMSFLRPSFIISHCSVLSTEWHELISSIQFNLKFNTSSDELESEEIKLCDDENSTLENSIDGLCKCSALKSVRKLNFENITLNDELVKKISNCENFSNLKSLNLYNSSITIESLKSIMKSPFANSLKNLKMESNYINKVNIEEIEKYLDELEGNNQQIGFWYFICGDIMRDHQDMDQEYVLKLFKKAANHNNYKAMLSIGVMYDIGPLPIDGIEAMNWYYKALNHGVGNAAINLGVIYRDGVYVKRDISKTVEYYSMAERMGKTKALFYLSLLYFEGEGVEQDSTKGFQLLKKAGQLGDADALCKIGQMYLRGEVVEVNEGKAFNYFKKAAKRGSAQSIHHLGVMYRNGQFVEQDKDKSFECYLNAARRGNSSAQICVADCYENDKHDMTEAIKWYVKAAMNGDGRAALYASTLFIKGEKVERNVELAFILLERAAESGNVEAQGYIGFLLENGNEGIGITINLPKAIQYYQMAASEGNASALFRLGSIFAENENYRDLDKAKEYFQKGCDLGDSYCQLCLAELLYNEKAYDKALHWINESIEQEQFYAIYTLGKWYKEGKAVELNYSKAIELFEKASVECDDALKDLADMYRNGLGVEKSEEKAEELLALLVDEQLNQ